MSNVILKFVKSHGPYVAGDVAGFAPDKARKLSGVARPYDAEADAEMEKAIAAAAADGTLSDKMKEALADVEAKANDLANREAALKEREDALANSGADPDTAGKELDPAKKAGAGDPPAQGKTAAKK